jgi:hypothetical protein
MEFRQTKHQVARGTRADGETFDRMVLVKRTSELRATYQIRLLTYRAVQEGKKVIIEVPKACRIHSSLLGLAREYRKSLTIVRA